MLDAFSSDAIPVHLLTREAFAGYLSRLAPHGVIVAHVSNRHMELVSVVGAVGAAEGLVAYVKYDRAALDFAKTYRANAIVVALAKDKRRSRRSAVARGLEARREPRRHRVDRRLFQFAQRHLRREIRRVITPAEHPANRPRKSRITARAALCPGAPVTPPPG